MVLGVKVVIKILIRIKDSIDVWRTNNVLYEKGFIREKPLRLIDYYKLLGGVEHGNSES